MELSPFPESAWHSPAHAFYSTRLWCVLVNVMQTRRGEPVPRTHAWAKPSVTEFRLFGIDLLPSCNLCFCWVQPYLIKPKLALLGRKYLLSCTWLSELRFCKPSSLLILTWSFSHLPHFSRSVLHSWVVRDAQRTMESRFQRVNPLLLRTNPTRDSFLTVRSRKGEDKAWSRAAQFSCLDRGVQRPLQEMHLGLPDVI